MSGLKHFLTKASFELGVTLATLYERQRALVAMGALELAPGRGPGSGVAMTPRNFSAVLISLLGTTTLTDVDPRIIGLLDSKPRGGGVSFRDAIADVLSGDLPASSIGVIRPSFGWIDGAGYGNRPTIGMTITAAIDGETLAKLVALVQAELPAQQRAA